MGKGTGVVDAGGDVTDDILTEEGDFLLKEDGDKIILEDG